MVWHFVGSLAVGLLAQGLVYYLSCRSMQRRINSLREQLHHEAQLTKRLTEQLSSSTEVVKSLQRLLRGQSPETPARHVH